MCNKFIEIKEGAITIEVPSIMEKKKNMLVFYNPEKVFDRTLTISLLNDLLKNKKKAKILDALSASGVRGLRYAVEINTKTVDEVWINDIKSEAYHLMTQNVLHNRTKLNTSIFIRNDDANKLFLEKINYFDVIDIDPFGSPVYFLENSIKALKNRGYLLVTATDTAPLSGSYPKTCRRKYGSIIHKTEFYPELALRVLVKKTIEIGAKNDIAMIPIFSYWRKDYIRVMFRKEKGAKKANELLNNFGYIIYDKNSLFRNAIHSVLEIKDIYNKEPKKFTLLGEIYLENIWNLDLLKNVLQRRDLDEKIRCFLLTIYEEAKVKVPFFYTTDSIARTFRISEPKLNEIIKAFTAENYKIARVHSLPKGFKTNCELSNIRKIFLEKWKFTR
ncbi:MAG: tRNA (guanine(26)-N(2))-dimethyltransferase [Candidatus Asgardarchaeia archaeon]